MKLVTIGAGEIGQALAGPARQNGHQVFFWDSDPKKCSAPVLEEVLSGADAVLFAVPSSALAEAMKEADRLTSKTTPFFFITKGLDPLSGEIPAEIAEKFRRPVLFLGGPLVAEEIQSGAGGFMAAAGSESVWPVAEKLFERGNLRVHGESDIFGASAAGVLKNFYAFLIGAAGAAGYGENFQSVILAEAAKELSKILPRFGGRPETAWNPAGVGDLHATAFSPHSRNRAAGDAFIRTGKLDERAESVRTWPILKKRLGDLAGYPLLRLAGEIMEGIASPEKLRDLIDSPTGERYN